MSVKTPAAIESRAGWRPGLAFRLADVGDGSAIQQYFTGLSPRSRYNRLMGASGELPPAVLDQFVRSDARSFTVLAYAIAEPSRIVGEVRAAVVESGIEFGLSVADALHGFGVGTELLTQLECRAARLGATMLFGETLRTNDAMIALAKRYGFRIAALPRDWKQVGLEKLAVAPAGNPCAAWQTAAL